MKTLTKKYQGQVLVNSKKHSDARRNILKFNHSKDARKTESYECLKFLFGESD